MMRKKTAAKTQPDFALEATTVDPWLVAIQSSERVILQAGATGFRTNQMRVADRHFLPAPELGEAFLCNTEHSEIRAELASSTREYFSQYVAPVTSISGSESWAATATVPLPPPHELELGLSRLLELRRSVRRFTRDLIGLVDVATIAAAAAGIKRVASGQGQDGGAPFKMFFRGVPSPGGLYPNEALILATNVADLPVGVYRYAPYQHALQRLGPLDVEAAGRALGHLEDFKIDIRSLGCVLVLVGSPAKVTRKYGARGVRFMLLEAGMMAFAANLAATSLGYGVLDYQSYFDDALLQVTGLQDRQFRIMHTLLLGWPAATTEGGNANESAL